MSWLNLPPQFARVDDGNVGSGLRELLEQKHHVFLSLWSPQVQFLPTPATLRERCHSFGATVSCDSSVNRGPVRRNDLPEVRQPEVGFFFIGFRGHRHINIFDLTPSFRVNRHAG